MYIDYEIVLYSKAVHKIFQFTQHNGRLIGEDKLLVHILLVHLLPGQEGFVVCQEQKNPG